MFTAVFFANMASVAVVYGLTMATRRERNGEGALGYVAAAMVFPVISGLVVYGLFFQQ